MGQAMQHLESSEVSTGAELGIDNWFGVQDARTRKVIQNRLAQRARRRGLAEAKARIETDTSHRKVAGAVKLAPKAPQPPPSETEEVFPGWDIGKETQQIQPQSSSSDLIYPTTSDTSPAFLQEMEIVAYNITHDTLPSMLTTTATTLHPSTDPQYLHMPSEGLFSALHNNGRLLRISCLYPVPRRSPPGTPDLPQSLHPVSLQMQFIHLPYIDCLPLPKLRHNLILFGGLIDDEEFCLDLTTSFSFVVIGGQSWEPSGWVVSAEFKERWPMLFS